MAKSMKKMLRQMFSVFEPEPCMEIGNYKYSLIEISSYFGRWNWCVLFLFFVVFCVGTSCLF